MDLNSYVESLETTSQSKFDNDFSGLNNIPILDDFDIEDVHGWSHLIDLDDINKEVELEEANTRGSENSNKLRNVGNTSNWISWVVQ